MKEVRHTGIAVSDLKRSLHFYEDLLGLQKVKTMTESGKYLDKVLGFKGVKVTTIKLSSDNGSLIELLYFFSPKSNSACNNLFNLGLTHIAFTVNDIEQEYKKLSEAGIVFTTVPQFSPDGCAKVAFCHGPDGEWLELVEVIK